MIKYDIGAISSDRQLFEVRTLSEAILVECIGFDRLLTDWVQGI